MNANNQNMLNLKPIRRFPGNSIFYMSVLGNRPDIIESPKKETFHYNPLTPNLDIYTKPIIHNHGLISLKISHAILEIKISIRKGYRIFLFNFYQNCAIFANIIIMKKEKWRLYPYQI